MTSALRFMLALALMVAMGAPDARAEMSLGRRAKPVVRARNVLRAKIKAKIAPRVRRPIAAKKRPVRGIRRLLRRTRSTRKSASSDNLLARNTVPRAKAPARRPQPAQPRGLRSSIKNQTKESKQLIKGGQLAAAAELATRSPFRNGRGQFISGPRSLSPREEAALQRMKNKVRRAAFKAVKREAERGNAQGAADALHALTILDSNGQLGSFRQWRKARLEKKAFKLALRIAKQTAKNKRGQLEVFEANQAFLASLPQARTAAGKKAMKALVKGGYKLAKRYSKAGDAERALRALQISAGIAHYTGVGFSESKAQGLVEAAYIKAAGLHLKVAAKLLSRGDRDQAAAYLAESLAIQGSMNVPMSARMQKKQKRMIKRLEPELVAMAGPQ